MSNKPDHEQGQISCYRAYLISAVNKIEQAFELSATTDEEATAQGGQLVDGHAIEVWDRSRMLIRFEPKAR